MKKIKVLHIGFSEVVGGIENYVLSVFRNIDRNKYDFHFLTYSEDRIAYEEEILKLGGTIHRLKNCRRRFFNRQHHNELKRLYKSENFDVVEKHIVDLYDIEAIRVACRCNVKIRILHSHAAGYYGKPTVFVKSNIFYNKIRYKKYVTNILGCSQDSLDFTFGKNNGIVVINGVESGKFFYDREERLHFREKLSIRNSDIVICNIGRAHKTKNQSFCIDVFARYNRLNSRSFLIIGGDGEELDKLKNHAIRLGVADRVIFLGSVSNCREVYNGSDLLLFPSIKEGFGITIIEALFTGLNCVCSSSIPEEIQENKHLVKIGLENSANDWALAIDKIGLNNHRDYNLFDTIYGIKKTIDKLVKVYTS